MDYTERVSEVLVPLAVEYPDSLGIATHQSAWYNVENFHRVFLLIEIGDMAQGASLWVDLHEATSAAGADEADINATTDVTTTETLTAGVDDNTLHCIECRTEEFDNGFNYVSVVAEVMGAAVEMSWQLFGAVPRYSPGTQTGWSSVTD